MFEPSTVTSVSVAQLNAHPHVDTRARTPENKKNHTGKTISRHDNYGRGYQYLLKY